jgi:hypothetical protein
LLQLLKSARPEGQALELDLSLFLGPEKVFALGFPLRLQVSLLLDAADALLQLEGIARRGKSGQLPIDVLEANTDLVIAC